MDKSIEVAAETPEADAGFYGLMGLIGLYVGIIPIAIGMLWLPWMRQLDRRWLQFLLALTIGLLVFLGIDAAIEGLDLGAVRRGVARRRGADVAGRGARVPRCSRGLTAGSGGVAEAASASRCWSRSASASTTSARAS